MRRKGKMCRSVSQETCLMLEEKLPKKVQFLFKKILSFYVCLSSFGAGIFIYGMLYVWNRTNHRNREALATGPGRL